MSRRIQPPYVWAHGSCRAKHPCSGWATHTARGACRTAVALWEGEGSLYRETCGVTTSWWINSPPEGCKINIILFSDAAFPLQPVIVLDCWFPWGFPQSCGWGGQQDCFTYHRQTEHRSRTDTRSFFLLAEFSVPIKRSPWSF